MTILRFPLAMNIIQFWIVDTIVKHNTDKEAIRLSPEEDEEDMLIGEDDEDDNTTHHHHNPPLSGSPKLTPHHPPSSLSSEHSTYELVANNSRSWASDTHCFFLCIKLHYLFWSLIEEYVFLIHPWYCCIK